MDKKYYLDTSVWMDYYEDRKDPSKDIGEYAFQLLVKLFASKSKIIVSTFLLRELEANYSLDIIRGIARPFQSMFIKVYVEEEKWEEARKISNQRTLPIGDVIHAILARDYNAILVSRDKHFIFLRDICETIKPEDLL